MSFEVRIKPRRLTLQVAKIHNTSKNILRIEVRTKFYLINELSFITLDLARINLNSVLNYVYFILIRVHLFSKNNISFYFLELILVSRENW